MRIFVTVGSVKPFDRLMKEIDYLSYNKNYNFIVQTGDSKYNFKNKNIIHKPFFSYSDFLDEIHKADIIITHDGMGTILNIIQFQKKCVIVPRQKKYGEVVYEQEDVSEILETRDVRIVKDVKMLKQGIIKATPIKPNTSDTFNYFKTNLNNYIKKIKEK